MPLHIILSDFVNEMNFAGLNMICEQLHLSYLLRFKYLLDVLVLCLTQDLGNRHVALTAAPRCFHLTVARKQVYRVLKGTGTQYFFNHFVMT